MIKKHGSAKWSGGIKDGEGQVSTETGVLSDQPYGFKNRFEGVKGTNPEELIGAAHAACYAMAMSGGFEDNGSKATSIDVKSTVSLEPDGDGFSITKIHLTVSASAPNIDEATFQKIAQETKDGCPVSKVLKGAEITMDAKLV